MNVVCRRLCSKLLPDKSSQLRSCLLVLLIIFCCTTILWDALRELANTRLMQCYARGGNMLPVLTDEEVEPGESIFFLETSCQDHGLNRDVRLNARQACAVESAALQHPSNSVFLLMTAPVLINLNSTKNPAVRAVLHYPNLKIRHINVNNYMAGTTLEDVFHGPLKRSRYPVSHTSDVLRYATLLKYQGTYLDLDVIVLNNLLAINNFVGAESPRSLGAGVINFGANDLGKQMAKECAAELKRTFQGSEWGNNGPGVITRVLNRKCNTTSVSDMLTSPCQFHVLPVHAFYAFPFWEAKMFFQPGKLEHAKKILNSSQVIHLWNKVTGRFRAPRGEVPLTYYARKHCPRVFQYVHGIM